ncbi:MAG: glycosyltransferase family 4 protein [bacterium]
MNILIINWRDIYNPLYGGAEIHITKIADYLKKSGNVFFLTSHYSGAPYSEKRNGINYIRMGNEYLFNYSVYMHLKKIIRYYGIDFVIEDINKIPFYTPLLTSKPQLTVVPHIFGESIFEQTNSLFASYVYLAEKPIPYVYKDKQFEVISRSTMNDLTGRGIQRDNITVIECGIDRTYAYMRRIRKSDKPLIVYVGRLKKYKSVQHIIRAMEHIKMELPRSKLIIAGKGDYESELIYLTQKLGLEKHVEFAGYISEEKKWQLLRQAWVSVYPSLIEGWGIVNIEANLMKTPVVCSDVEGLRDSVKNNYSGMLYEYGNIGDLSSSILALLKNEGLRAQYENNALEWAENFTWENTGKRTEILINSIAGY